MVCAFPRRRSVGLNTIGLGRRSCFSSSGFGSRRFVTFINSLIGLHGEQDPADIGCLPGPF